MDLNEALTSAWKELAGEEVGQPPAAEQATESDVSEPAADSTPVEGTSEPEADDVEATDPVEGEGENEDSDEEAEAEPGTAAVEIDDETVVSFRGKEAKASDLFELKSDYTKKTQELAEQRETVAKQAEEVTRVYDEMVAWYQDRSAKPVEWLAEIAADTGDATKAVALLITHLNDQGALDPKFVEVFDLKAPDHPVSQVARDASVETRIRELEEDRAAAAAERERVAQEQEVQAAIDRQVADLVKAENLRFSTDSELKQFRIDLFETATSAGITDLTVAYELMMARKGRDEAASNRKKDALAKKRSQRVVSKPEPAAPAAGRDARYSSVDDAARAALDAMLSR